MRDNEDLDLLLDLALDTYADPGPESGLEQRILIHIRADIEARKAVGRRQPIRRHWLPWVTAAPLAAGLLLFFLLTSKGPHTLLGQRAPLPPSPAERDAKVVTPLHAEPVHRMKTRAPLLSGRSTVVVQSAVARPKLDVFPAPQPLNTEERALAVVATETSVPVRQEIGRASCRERV